MRHFKVGAVLSLQILHLFPCPARYVAYLANMYSRKILCKKLAFFFLIAVLLFVGSLAAKEFVRVKFFDEKKHKKTCLFFSLLNVGGLVRN